MKTSFNNLTAEKTQLVERVEHGMDILQGLVEEQETGQQKLNKSKLQEIDLRAAIEQAKSKQKALQ